MDTIAAADAKTNFGALLDKAQRGGVIQASRPMRNSIKSF